MATPKEMEDVLRANGVKVEDVVRTLEDAVSSGKIDNAQARQEVENLYTYYLNKKQQESPAKQSQDSSKIEAPGALQGTSREFATGATFGAAPYIAGETNILARRLGNVLTGIIDGDLSQIRRGAFPTYEEKQQYRKEGRREYLESQKAFQKERPVLATAGRLAGDVASIVATAPVGGVAGGIAKTGATALRAGETAASFAGRTAAGASSFATYEGLKGLFNQGEGISSEGAGKGVLKGGLLGLAFSWIGGGLAAGVESPLIKAAADMTGLGGMFVRGGIRTATTAAEGAAVATAAAGIERGLGEERSALPSKEEIITGALGIGGLRAIGAGVQEGARLTSKLKAPTTRQTADINARAINEQYENIQDEIRQVANEKGKPLDTERINQLKAQQKELNKEMEPIVETAQKDIEAIAKKEGWKKEKGITADTNSGYEVFSKDGKTVEFRLSNHEPSRTLREGEIEVDLRNPYDDNLVMVRDTLRAVDKLPAGEKLPKKVGISQPVPTNVTPTEAQISTVKAEHLKATGKELGDEMANAIAKQRNIDLTISEAQRSGKALLPMTERIRRAVGATLRKGGEIIDTYVPLGRTHKVIAEAPGGKKLEVGETAPFILKQRDRGGRVSVRQAPLVDELDQKMKADKTFVERWQQYMVAKKDEDMLPSVIERLKKGNKNGANNELIAQKEAQLERARALAAETEAADSELVAYAQKHWDYGQEQLDELYEAGRISKEAYEKWKGNKHYVHSVAKLPGESELPSLFTEAEEEAINRQSGISDALKRYEGYEGGYNNMALGNLAQGKRIAYFADTQKAMKAWLKDAIKTGEARKLEPGEYFKRGDYPVINEKNQIISWNNGIPEVYEVPQNVARIFNPVIKKENFLLRNLRLTNNVFKLGTTGISSGFSAMNLLRDWQSVIGGSRSGQYFSPAFLKNSAEMYGPTSKDLPENLKELRDLIDEKLGTEFSLAQTQLNLDRSEINRLNTMLEAQGQANKSGTFIGDIMALLMKSASMAKAPAEKSFQKVANGLSFLGNWSEKIGRATVFQTELRRQAGSQKQFEFWMQNPKKNIPKSALDNAGKEMTEVTLDFNRKMHPVIESLNKYAFPYFKPSLLGAERVWKILTDPEIAPQAWRWIATVGTLQGLLRSNMSEEQKKKYLSQFNPEISAKSVSFMNKDGVLTTIPANQEFGGLYQWVAAGAEWAANKLKGKEQRDGMLKEVEAAAKQLAQNAIPGGYLLEPSNMAPTPVGKLILEESINKDIYSKTDIESAAMRRLPVEERYSPSTPMIYRLMSKKLKIGNLQSSPKMWEHRAKKLGSSFAKEMADLADTVLEFSGIGEEEWNLPKKIEEGSIMGRFFNKDYTAYARNVQEYDDEIKEIEQAYNSYKKTPTKDKEKKDKAALYKAIKPLENQRVQLISYNQELLASLRRKGLKEWKRYLDGEITKAQFDKMKELESAKVASKYYANQKKISDITDKMLAKLRKEKKKRGIK